MLVFVRITVNSKKMIKDTFQDMYDKNTPVTLVFSTQNSSLSESSLSTVISRQDKNRLKVAKVPLSRDYLKPLQFPFRLRFSHDRFFQFLRNNFLHFPLNGK